MAAQTYEKLAKKSVAELRASAKELEHDALQRYQQMTKEQLVGALCTAQDIEIPVHRRGPALDRKAVKTKIQELKAKRQAAVESKDSTQLARARRRIQRLKRKLRAATI